MFDPEFELKDGFLYVHTRLGDRPLQVVRISEITGMSLYRDPAISGFTFLSLSITLLSAIYSPLLALLFGFMSALVFWQYLNRSKLTVLYAHGQVVTIRGHVPEIFERLMKYDRRYGSKKNN